MTGTAQGGRIDPMLIPDSEYEVACSVLAKSIRLALADEEKRKEFERWKAERARRREAV